MENLSVPSALSAFASPVEALEQEDAQAVVSALGEWVPVVAAADAALYEAKRGGRNRVRRAEP